MIQNTANNSSSKKYITVLKISELKVLERRTPKTCNNNVTCITSWSQRLEIFLWWWQANWNVAVHCSSQLRLVQRSIHYAIESSLLQELVVDVAVAMSFRHVDLPWARRFDVASPRFIGRRSASTVRSQDCLGRPALRLQSSGGPIMQACRARNGLVRGWCSAGVQRRTDGGCGQCRTRTAAQYESVSRHWWQIQQTNAKGFTI